MKKYIIFCVCLIISACGQNKPGTVGVGGSTATSPGGAQSNTHDYVMTITAPGVTYAPAIITNQGSPDEGSLSPGPQTGNNVYSITGRTANPQVTMISSGICFISVTKDGTVVWTYTLNVSGTYTFTNI